MDTRLAPPQAQSVEGSWGYLLLFWKPQTLLGLGESSRTPSVAGSLLSTGVPKPLRAARPVLHDPNLGPLNLLGPFKKARSFIREVFPFACFEVLKLQHGVWG